MFLLVRVPGIGAGSPWGSMPLFRSKQLESCESLPARLSQVRQIASSAGLSNKRPQMLNRGSGEG